MPSDEPFPLEAVPSRVRYALLLEFKGRCPSLQEVDQIPDKHWLTMPGMGPNSLAMVRSIIDARVPQAPSHAGSKNLSDAELLWRLEEFQKDLRWLEAQIRRRLDRRRRKQAARDDIDNSGHQTERSELASRRGYVP